MDNKNDLTEAGLFGTEKIWKVLLKLTPPVMLAQLIQALYNVVDSLFIGRYSVDGLTALSVVYPIQLIIIALAVGTGVGVNTYMAKQYALGNDGEANKAAGTGTLLAIIMWALFAVVSVFILKPYAASQASSAAAIQDSFDYGIIVCVGSIGVFLESNWTKVHQAKGNMKLPMIAQIVGAVVNIALDPLLIFGIWIFPEMGVKGAAIATIVGQIVTAVIVGVKGCKKFPDVKSFGRCAKNIYKLGYPSIFMQGLFTVYIALLNVILGRFCDEAITVLGLYYKLQSFFFIPLFGLQTCIVPMLSYNYANNNYKRVKSIFGETLVISGIFMIIAVVAFEAIPTQLISIFSASEKVKAIGRIGFRIIGASFIPAVFSLTFPVFFQAIGYSKTSAFTSVLRQLILLVPIFWLLSLKGLNYSWISFPVSETATTLICLGIYVHCTRSWKDKINSPDNAACIDKATETNIESVGDLTGDEIDNAIGKSDLTVNATDDENKNSNLNDGVDNNENEKSNRIGNN